MTPLRRRALPIALALAGVAALVWWLRTPATEVDVGTVVRGPLRVTVDEEGETRIRHRYVIAAPAEGHLLRIALEAGDPVSAGEVVARLRPAPLEPRSRAAAEARLQAAHARQREAAAQVAKAQAALAQAQRDLARARRLHEAGTLAPGEREQHELEATSRARELEAARFAADAAEHELEVARAALLAPGLDPEAPVTADPTCGDAPCLALRAPVAGRVLRVNEASERTVAPGAPLLEIGDPADLEIVSDLLSTDAVKVKPGDAVEVEEWGGGRPLHARVRTVEPSGFTKISALGVEEQRVNMVADFVGSPDGLGDGYRVEVRIVVWEAPDVLQVPVGGLFRCGEGWCVYRVERNRARRTEVSIGERGAREAQLLGGLEENARVVLHPGDRIEEGTRVRLREEAAASLPTAPAPPATRGSP